MEKFYFCTAGTKNSPCEFKCELSDGWYDHMELEHDIVNPTLPPLREYTRGIDATKVKGFTFVASIPP